MQAAEEIMTPGEEFFHQTGVKTPFLLQHIQNRSTKKFSKWMKIRLRP
jgi:hypothetical protein